ncbi:MAG: hypothetical protein AB8I69_03155 [Anaerolineae bacterium]
MEQEGIPANPAQSGCLCDEPKLKATLSGIINDPVLESVSIEPLLEIDADLKCVIVRITTFNPVSWLMPSPLFRCDHVMANDDCGGSPRHKG